MSKFEQPVSFVRLNLPDGTMAMQRRTDDAPTSPNKLQWFGGHKEEGETMLEAAVRELEEETDLPVKELDFDYVGYYWVPKKDGRRQVGLTVATIDDPDFSDFEGTGKPEIWTPIKALESGELTTSVQYILSETINVRFV